jgi:hypothetical protein
MRYLQYHQQLRPLQKQGWLGSGHKHRKPCGRDGRRLMPGFSIEFEEDLIGPMFDGTGFTAIEAYCDEVRHTEADQIERMIKFHLAIVLKQDHGVYIGAIHQEASGDEITVTDRWIVYGPWLEGVGTRVGPRGSGHWPLTRFPGYHTFRIVFQEYDRIALERAEEMLPPYIAILQGTA